MTDVPVASPVTLFQSSPCARAGSNHLPAREDGARAVSILSLRARREQPSVYNGHVTTRRGFNPLPARAQGATR